MRSKIARIEIEDGDVTFYFEDQQSMPYSVREFIPDTETRKKLTQLEREILDYNGELGAPNGRGTDSSSPRCSRFC